VTGGNAAALFLIETVDIVWDADVNPEVAQNLKFRRLTA
jgi:hypothetical protein